MGTAVGGREGVGVGVGVWEWVHVCVDNKHVHVERGEHRGLRTEL